MALLLTILSVIAVWAFLTVLVVGLLLILKPLQHTRGYLEKIAMGVRAIEHQLRPLGERADAFAGVLGGVGGALDRAAGHLASADQNLEAAAPALQPRG
jgi:hypothetical protein